MDGLSQADLPVLQPSKLEFVLTAKALGNDLTAPSVFQPPKGTAKNQIVVPEPTTLVTLDTQWIIVDPSAGGPLDNAQWNDSTPKLLQEKIIQSLEASNYVGAVARPMEGLTADYQLLIDLQDHGAVDGTGSPRGVRSQDSRRCRSNRRVTDLRRGGSAKDVSAAGAAAALDEAFGKTATSLVEWTATVI